MSRLTELPLDVMLRVESVPAERIDGGVRLGSARETCVESSCRAARHQIGGLDLRPRRAERELDPLIGADRATEDLARLRVPRRALDEPAPVADELGGNENSFRIPAVEDVAEPHTLGPDQGVRG